MNVHATSTKIGFFFYQYQTNSGLEVLGFEDRNGEEIELSLSAAAEVFKEIGVLSFKIKSYKYDDPTVLLDGTPMRSLIQSIKLSEGVFAAIRSFVESENN